MECEIAQRPHRVTAIFQDVELSFDMTLVKLVAVAVGAPVYELAHRSSP